MNNYFESNNQAADEAAKHADRYFKVIADDCANGFGPALDGFQAGVDSIVLLSAIRRRIVAARLTPSIVDELDFVIAGLADDIGLLEDTREFEETGFGSLL